MQLIEIRDKKYRAGIIIEINCLKKNMKIKHRHGLLKLINRSNTPEIISKLSCGIIITGTVMDSLLHLTLILQFPEDEMRIMHNNKLLTEILLNLNIFQPKSIRYILSSNNIQTMGTIMRT